MIASIHIFAFSMGGAEAVIILGSVSLLFVNSRMAGFARGFA